MNFRGYVFPPALDEQLKQLVREGVTMQRIADSLKLSRGQVAGRIYRLRVQMKDETFRAGYVVGRLYVPPGQGDPNGKHARAKKAKGSGWAKWRNKNGGAIMAAIKANSAANIKAAATRAMKNERKQEAHKMMRHHICCCENPVDLFTRTGCCWPLWGDDPVPFSDKLYCNNINEQGNKYCSAHARLRTEYVPGVMLPQPGKQRFGQFSIKRRAA